MPEHSAVETLFIDGAWSPARSGGQFTVRNPADDAVVAVVSDGDVADAERAVDAAVAAFATWSRTTVTERSRLLNAVCQAMLAQEDALAELISKENGKTRNQALWEVRNAAAFFGWNAEECRRSYGSTVPAAAPDQRIQVLKQPVGPVAAITPWNFPLSLVARKVAPALAAGCTVVLRPADLTPLAAVELARILECVGLPAGVMNLVTSTRASEVGDVFLTDPRIRKVAFTGSTAVGKLLMGKAARSVKRVSMELGGHAPFLVFADADLDHAVECLVQAKVLNAGQTCTAPNRILVHRSVEADFCDRLLARLQGLVVGDGLADGVDMGPLVSPAAVQRVQALVDEAVGAGALLPPGQPDAAQLPGGCFLAPVVLREVSPDMQVWQQEAFGPVFPVTAFDDDDQALALANDTWAGLAAYCFTTDLARSTRVVEGLDFGIVGVNDVRIMAPQAPFGGHKESGIGYENGAPGLEQYLELKSVYVGV